MRKIATPGSLAHIQSVDRQLGALRAERADLIFCQTGSGKSTGGRPELKKALDELGTGDILVVTEWNRATRSMFDGINLVPFSRLPTRKVGMWRS